MLMHIFEKPERSGHESHCWHWKGGFVSLSFIQREMSCFFPSAAVIFYLTGSTQLENLPDFSLCCTVVKWTKFELVNSFEII